MYDTYNKALFGTGTLLNNFSRNYNPIIYTAGHIAVYPGEAANDILEFKQSKSKFYRFYFNYTLDLPFDYFDKRENYILGCQILAHGNCHDLACPGQTSDQVLLKLRENPKLSQKVFFNGFQFSTNNYVSIHHPWENPQKITFGNFGGAIYSGDFQSGSTGASFADINTKRVFANLSGFSGGNNHRPSFCSAGYPRAYTLSQLENFALSDMGQQVGVRPFLTPENSTITYMDGEDYCPNNTVSVTSSNFYSVLQGINNNAKTFTLNDFRFVEGNYLLDLQAVEQTRITSANNNNSRFKPLAGKIRMSVHPCTRGNPSSGRMEAEHTGTGNYRFFVNAFPNPSWEHVTFTFSEAGHYTLVLFDAQGLKVLETTINGVTEYRIYTFTLAPGLYVTQASNGMALESRKVILR